MRTLTLACVSALTFLWLALGAQPALASDVDCTSGSPCSFFSGTLVASIGPTAVGPGNGTWTGTFSENVYQTGTVYTYVFDLVLNTMSSGNMLTGETTGVGPSAADYFNSALHFGVVFFGGTLTNTSGTVDDAFFTFAGATLQTNGTNMNAAGQTYEFYAQSTLPPGSGQFNALDGGTTTTPSLDPTPEPGSILLFGTGLLMLGAILRRRSPQQLSQVR